MRKQYWAKRDPIKNYFPLLNEIFSLGLSSTAIYGYLLFRKDRKTYECLASYQIIGEAIGKSVTTVRKYVAEQDKSMPPCWHHASHFCPQCGQFTGMQGDLIPERKKGI